MGLKLIAFRMDENETIAFNNCFKDKGDKTAFLKSMARKKIKEFQNEAQNKKS